MPPSSTSVPPAATKNCCRVTFHCAPSKGAACASLGSSGGRGLRSHVGLAAQTAGREHGAAVAGAGQIAEPGAKKIQERAHARQHVLGTWIERPDCGIA